MPSNMSDEEDDELLMAAAGQWAASNDNDSSSSAKKKKSKKSKKSKNEKKAKKSKRDKPEEESDASGAQAEQTPARIEQNTTAPRQVFSLHLTKVPYEATQTDIRFAFGEKGCSVTSVRLVYDQKLNGERSFRGVAFVDLADEVSFQKGLELHGTKFLGNKHNVNVRPTKSKGELSEIVRKTQEKVATLIARSKEKAREERASNPDAYDAKQEAKKDKKKLKRKRGRNSDSTDGEKTNTKKRKKGGGSDLPKHTQNDTVGKKKSNKSTPKKGGVEQKKKHDKSKSKNDDVKLTKKQRAKKAAVINMLKRKKMK